MGIGGEMLWRSAAASVAVFDLLERRAQEASRPRSLQHVARAVHVTQI